MSTQQVERLTALLARVQRNRGLPRGDNGASRPQAAPMTAPVAAAPPARRAEPPVAAVPTPPAAVMATPAGASAAARARPAPTPLEMAFEGRVSQPEQLTQPIDLAPLPTASSSGGTAAASRGGASADTAASRGGASGRDGRVLAEPNTPEPSKPIVQVVSKQPPHTAASFGELLRRSLSLRPR
jgi:hypothetical protein